MQMPTQTGLHSAHKSNVGTASNLDDLAGVEGLMPKFARRRTAPAAHQVITDEVGAEMYDLSEGDVANFKDSDSRMQAGEEESKDDPWGRLNDLSTFHGVDLVDSALH